MKETENKILADVNGAVYTLGIASQLSGIPAHSIRQYIEKGLLIPFKRDSMRHLFSMNDISRLKHIHHLIQDRGLNFAGIRALLSMVPCWKIKECAKKDSQECKGILMAYQPCWEASKKSLACKNENCRECEVYTCLSNSAELKSVLRELF